MAKRNVARPDVHTHEGGKASAIGPFEELKRSVLACMLWEKTFYEQGEDVAARIERLTAHCKGKDVEALALEARTKFNLRHAPLWLITALLRNKQYSPTLEDTIYGVIQRTDEMGELIAMYMGGPDRRTAEKRSLPAVLKRGVARAFTKFDMYQLAKYKGSRSGISLRDVMFMVHPKPQDQAQELAWKKLAEGTLEAPDTWEVALSGGADKKETFTRLLDEKRLGYMALLRNLRNMEEAGVNRLRVKEALLEGKGRHRVLPFRFVSAARMAPVFEPELDKAMVEALEHQERLPGRTVALIDVSGSMSWGNLGERSILSPMDAAAALAILLRGICDSVEVFTFSNNVVRVPARKGMALRDAIVDSQHHAGTWLSKAIQAVNKQTQYDRIVVFTDEQSHDGVSDPLPGSRAYMINVSSYERGVGYGRWTHITGFSHACVDYIREFEDAM